MSAAFSTLFGGPVAHAIGWALVHLLWQGVLVAAILAAALALMQRQSANARYLAACGALALLLAVGAATAYHVYEPAAPAAPFLSSGAAAFMPPDGGLKPAAPLVVETATWRDGLAAVAVFANDHLPQFVLAWMLGVLLLSVRLTAGWIRAHRIATRDAVAATPEWQRIARRLSHALRIRGAIELLESAAVEVPTVIGWLRPVVLLPVATLSGLSAEQMEMVLAHELAHVRRHDFFVNLMQAVVETLLFYHPAVWWISGRIRVEREHCCDDVAVAVCGNPLQYARALTRLEELRVDPAQAVIAANGGSLFSRIRRLAGGRAEAPNGPSRWAAGAALLTVLAALLITPSLPLSASADEPKAAAKAPKPKAAATRVEVVGESTSHATSASSSDSESDDPSDEVELDDENDGDTPEPMVHVAPMAVVTPRIDVGPAVRAVTAAAPAIAMSALASLDAIRDGVEGGVEGGVQGTPAPEPPDPPRAFRLRDRHKIGASGKLTVDDLISLRAAGVTPAYIEEMRGAGLGELTLDEIAAMRTQGVTAGYVKSLRAAGLKLESADTVVALKVQGVTAEYLEAMRAAGYANATTRELISMRAMGVSPAYVKQLSDAGYKNLTAHDLTSLRAMGVTPEFIRSLSDAGYTNLSVKDLTRMAAVGVNADFIRDLAKYRTK